MCSLFSRISNSFTQISNLFPPGQSVLSDCNSFPRIRQSVLSNCNSFPQITHCPIRGNELQSERTSCPIRGNELLIRGN